MKSSSEINLFAQSSLTKRRKTQATPRAPQKSPLLFRITTPFESSSPRVTLDNLPQKKSPSPRANQEIQPYFSTLKQKLNRPSSLQSLATKKLLIQTNSAKSLQHSGRQSSGRLHSSPTSQQLSHRSMNSTSSQRNPLQDQPGKPDSSIDEKARVLNMRCITPQLIPHANAQKTYIRHLEKQIQNLIQQQKDLKVTYQQDKESFEIEIAQLQEQLQASQFQITNLNSTIKSQKARIIELERFTKRNTFSAQVKKPQKPVRMSQPVITVNSAPPVNISLPAPSLPSAVSTPTASILQQQQPAKSILKQGPNSSLPQQKPERHVSFLINDLVMSIKSSQINTPLESSFTQEGRSKIELIDSMYTEIRILLQQIQWQDQQGTSVIERKVEEINFKKRQLQQLIDEYEQDSLT